MLSSKIMSEVTALGPQPLCFAGILFIAFNISMAQWYHEVKDSSLVHSFEDNPVNI